MMNNFSQIASELFMQGYSCSESVVKAAYEAGIIKENIDPDLLNRIASPFSGAMGTHQCLCGAIAGSQLVLGLLYGRTSPSNDPNKIKKLANKFNTEFIKKRKTTCCRALRIKYKNDPKAARENCTNIVQDCTNILENMVEKVGSRV